MDIFKMMKQAMNMKSKMKEIQAVLGNKSAVVDSDNVSVTLSCDLKKVACSIKPEAVAYGAEKLGSIISRNMQQVLDKAKQTAAEELKGALGGIDPGGLTDLLK